MKNINYDPHSEQKIMWETLATTRNSTFIPPLIVKYLYFRMLISLDTNFSSVYPGQKSHRLSIKRCQIILGQSVTWLSLKISTGFGAVFVFTNMSADRTIPTLCDCDKAPSVQRRSYLAAATILPLSVKA